MKAAELNLAGIDLDTCRNPDTGEMTPWAQEILDRFPSYAEVSPSQTGVKVFFLIRTEDKAELASYPKAYRKAAGGDHTPGIECYVGGRYFTITGQLYGNETALRVIPIETVRWLHEVAGPALKGKPAQKERKQVERAQTSDGLAWSPEAEARVRSALKAIPNDGKQGLDYDDWLAVQMAIHSTGWPCAETLADEFSQRCDRYNAKDQDYKWDSYDADHTDGVAIGTIFKMATEHGWVDPALADADNIVQGHFTDLGLAIRLVDRHHFGHAIAKPHIARKPNIARKTRAPLSSGLSFGCCR